MSNYDGTALASAARTATTNSADLGNPDARGVMVFFDVTAGATLLLTLSIEGKDPASGKYVSLMSGASVTGVATNMYVLHPAITETANVDAAVPLPATWRIKVTHGNATSTTYTVGYSLLG